MTKLKAEILFASLLILASLLLFSCAGELQGDKGERGEKGEPGEEITQIVEVENDEILNVAAAVRQTGNATNTRLINIVNYSYADRRYVYTFARPMRDRNYLVVCTIIGPIGMKSITVENINADSFAVSTGEFFDSSGPGEPHSCVVYE